MLILFAFIAIGFILSKTKVLPDNSSVVLSRLENFVFVPALVMGTFIKNFTTENISSLWKILLFSVILLALLLPFSFLFAKMFCKDEFLKKIVIYGLEFSNFGFMGNAVVLGLETTAPGPAAARALACLDALCVSLDALVPDAKSELLMNKGQKRLF